MSDVIIDKVSVRIGSQMYGRFEDLPNTVPHVLAEFVDNALQSFRDKREELLAIDPDYKLRVQIFIHWDENETKMSLRKATRFVIEDNAGGIAANRFVNAFEPANAPDNNTGLNEFGMGLKTAACWLGYKWVVKTKALGEGIARVVSFDQNLVTKNNLEEIDVKNEAGIVVIQSLNAEEFSLDIGAGEAIVKDFRAMEADFSCGAGEIRAVGNVAKKMDVDCGIGEVVLTLDGTEEESACEVACGVGEVVIGDVVYEGIGSEHHGGKNHNGSKEIEVDCGVGSVTVQFETGV